MVAESGVKHQKSKSNQIIISESWHQITQDLHGIICHQILMNYLALQSFYFEPDKCHSINTELDIHVLIAFILQSFYLSSQNALTVYLQLIYGH